MFNHTFENDTIGDNTLLVVCVVLKNMIKNNCLELGVFSFV